MIQDRLNEILFSGGLDVISNNDIDGLIIYADKYFKYLSNVVDEYQELCHEVVCCHDNPKNYGKSIIFEGVMDCIRLADAMKNLASAFATTRFTAQQAANAMQQFGRVISKSGTLALD